MADQPRVREKQNATYLILLVITLAITAGRIATVTNKEGDAAFQSANDRSRWCTVAAIVEDHTYAIDRQQSIRDANGRRPWGTIDKVRHRGKDGKQHDYSSKPPLFPTIIAGMYAVVSLVSGVTLTEQPVVMTRVMLALVNLPLLAIFLFSTLLTIERVTSSSWSRRYLNSATCFGTMIVPFSVSLNNHLPAAAMTALVMYLYCFAAERLDDHDKASRGIPFWYWLLAGAAAAFAVANELPALAMLAFWFVGFVWLDRASAIGFILGAAVVVAAFLATNKLAHDSFRPPYMHRGTGELIAEVQLPDGNGSDSEPTSLDVIRDVLVGKELIEHGVSLQLVESAEEGRWIVQSSDEQQFSATPVDLENARWQLAHWDDWYEYPGSYWQGKRQGVDRGEPSRLLYLLHLTVGHHGVFSISPILILVPMGLLAGVTFGPSDYKRLLLAIAISSVVCICFYVARPLIDRNYGGVSCCFRWLLWFTPLWLVATVPAVEELAKSRRGAALLLVLLAISVFSAAMSYDGPWESPWIYRLSTFLGWIEV